MKLSKITISCLAVATVLTAGVLYVSAAGFVTFENDSQLIFWDNVRMVGKGLKMSGLGIGDTENTTAGTVKIFSKDIFIRGLLGFECTDYPAKTDCKAAIGNIGSAFLSMDQVSSTTNLTLESANTNLSLNTLTGAPISIQGQLLIGGAKNLYVTNLEVVPAGTSSVYVNDLKVDQINNTGMFLPGIIQHAGIYFPPIKYDLYSEDETDGSYLPIFRPRKSIILDLSFFTSP